MAAPISEIVPYEPQPSTEFSDNESSDRDYEVELSDREFDDNEDDDLFSANVDSEITERVSMSLKSNTGVSLPVAEDVLTFEGENSDFRPDSDDELATPPNSDDEGNMYPTFNPLVDFKGKVLLTLGLTFPTVEVCRKAIQYHAIENGYDYYFLANDPGRVSVYCKNRCGCDWKHARVVQCSCGQKRKCLFKIHCRKLEGVPTLQIKSLRLDHVCGFQTVNSKVTSQYLAEKYLEEWRDNPTWKLRSFILKCKRDLGVEVKYHKAYYARQRAFLMIYGDAFEEYKRVWDYVATIRKYYPGSTAAVKVESVENPPTLFQRMYICLQPCKEGFIAGCRPILGVDGCHLKGPYPGILLTAVGKDGNNNIFPVAWAVVEVENTETWTWFLELLSQDLGSVASAMTFMLEREEPVTYISDRQKGLLDAFRTVVPNAETRYCCRHIWANFKTRYPGEVYRQKFWEAARASTKSQFKCAMEGIKLISVEAFNWLSGIPAANWSRHAFSTKSKSGMLLNNCCESFNNVLREARTKPVLSMMEWIRRWVMRRNFMKKQGLSKFDGVIMPSVMKLIEKGKEYARQCNVNQADLWEFEVDHYGDTYVVNLEKRTCGCYRWDLLGIPCIHAQACLDVKRLNPEEYVDKAYHVESYAATYGLAFPGMAGIKDWEETDMLKPNPPTIRVMPGRPSGKKRVKEPGEGLVIREKKARKCSNCGAVGHNIKKCTNPPATKEPKSKGGRPPATDPIVRTVLAKRKRKNTNVDQGQSSTQASVLSLATQASQSTIASQASQTH